MGPLALNKLVAYMYAENHGSIRVFRKAGWRKEGLLRRHYMLDGTPSDLIVVGLTRREFLEQQDFEE